MDYELSDSSGTLFLQCVLNTPSDSGLGFDHVNCVCVVVFLVGLCEWSSGIRVLIMVNEINLWDEIGF